MVTYEMMTAESRSKDAKVSKPDRSHNLVAGWLIGQRSVHTRRAYAWDIKLWLGYCKASGLDPVTGVSRVHVDAWMRSLEQRGDSAATRSRRLAAVASWYRWLRQEGHTTIHPTEHVRRPEVDPDHSSTPGLTAAQAVALLRTADTDPGSQRLRTAAIVALLLYTGMRIGELVAADVADLGANRGHRTLTVVRKGGRRQALVLPPAAARRLDAYLAARPDLTGDQLPVLPTVNSGGRRGIPLIATATGRIRNGEAWRLVRRLAAATPELSDVAEKMCPHALRHTHATLALDAGASLRDLQDALGQRDPRTTRRYDRARGHLDRSTAYSVASHLAAAGGQ